MFIVFIQNTTLLVSAIVVYTIIIRRWEKGSIFYSIFSGLLFGIVAVLGMRMPLVLEPGVIFDGRSIIHSIAGLFGGPYTALAAALISASYRAYIGGGGAVVGIFTIVQSSAFGVAIYFLIKRSKLYMTPLNLIFFSLLVHLIMLFSFTYIPGLSLNTILNQLALPIILIYPPTTLIIANIINAQEIKLNTEKELKENELRLKKTQEIAQVGSWELDQPTDKLTWSEEVYRIVGTHEEAFQLSYNAFLDVVHPDDRAVVDQAFSDSILEGKDHYDLEHRLIRLDTGETRYVHERCEHIKNSAGKIIRSIGMIQDITERKEYESQLLYMSLHDQLTGLYNRTYFEEELKRLTPSREYPISIISADLDGLKLINDTLGHSRGDDVLVACAKVLKRSLRQSDTLARIGGDEFALILPKTNAETGEAVCSRIRESLELFNHENSELPLSLSLGLATSNKQQEGALYALLKIADAFMYRDKLHHRSSKRNQIVQALMTALSERDFISEGHADRVQKLCYELGIKTGLSSSQLADLALLAQVHDLGKVGIPDHILFKPGPLNKDEWEIMQMHPEKGYRIASSSPDLSTVAELILKHHEHWNGHGYPLGLEGGAIPVECRILSIIDAYDAMTNDRPYSSAKSKSEAIEELQKCSGTQFDPHLVSSFIEILM